MTVKATDEVGTFASQGFSIIVNGPPVLGVTDTNVSNIDPTTISSQATDPNLPVDDVLTFSLITPPSGVSIDPNTGVITFTPNGQALGTVIPVTVHVQDADGLTDEKTFDITVRANPTIDPLTTGSATEHQLATFPVVANDADTGDTLTYSLVDAPAGATINPTTGLILFTPTETQGGSTVSITVRVTDSYGLTADSILMVDVIEDNFFAPVLANILSQGINAGENLTVQLNATDGDLPAQTLTYLFLGATVNNVAVMLTNTPTIDANGVLHWTPDVLDGPGPYSFTVSASDGTLSDSTTFTVFLNQAPTFGANPGTQTATEHNQFQITVAATDVNVPANAGGDVLTYTLTDDLGNAIPNATINPTTGAITFTPSELQGDTTIKFKVTVTDSKNLSDTVQFDVNINEMNVAPVLDAVPNQTINAGSQLTVQLHATDSDLPAQSLIYSLVSGPANAIFVPETGLLQWVPTAADGLSQDFTVSVSDGIAPPVTRSFTVTINQAPVLTVAPQTIDENVLFQLQLAATDANPGETFTYTRLNGPAGLTISSSGLLRWTPTEAQGGSTNSVTVRVRDANGLTTDTIFNITVNKTNSAPTAGTTATQQASEGTLFQFTPPFTDIDLPAQTLTYSLLNGPDGATINTATGQVSWTPTEADGGTTRQFQVTATDPENASATLTFNVAVTETNQTPTLAVESVFEIDELTTLAFQAFGADSDTPVQTLTYSLVDAPSGMTIDAGTGEVIWTPTEAQGPGEFLFSIKVTDSLGASATQQVHVTIFEVNDAPTITNGTSAANAFQGSTLNFQIAGFDADAPVQTLTYDLLDGPAGLAINSLNGLVTWSVPSTAELGSFSFTVQVTDSAGLSTSQVFALTVQRDQGGGLFALFNRGNQTAVAPVSLSGITTSDTSSAATPVFVPSTANVAVESLNTLVTPDNLVSGLNRLQAVNEAAEKQDVKKPVTPDSTNEGDATSQSTTTEGNGQTSQDAGATPAANQSTQNGSRRFLKNRLASIPLKRFSDAALLSYNFEEDIMNEADHVNVLPGRLDAPAAAAKPAVATPSAMEILQAVMQGNVNIRSFNTGSMSGVMSASDLAKEMNPVKTAMSEPVAVAPAIVAATTDPVVAVEMQLVDSSEESLAAEPTLESTPVETVNPNTDRLSKYDQNARVGVGLVASAVVLGSVASQHQSGEATRPGVPMPDAKTNQKRPSRFWFGK